MSEKSGFTCLVNQSLQRKSIWHTLCVDYMYNQCMLPPSWREHELHVAHDAWKRSHIIWPVSPYRRQTINDKPLTTTKTAITSQPTNLPCRPTLYEIKTQPPVRYHGEVGDIAWDFLYKSLFYSQEFSRPSTVAKQTNQSTTEEDPCRLIYESGSN